MALLKRIVEPGWTVIDAGGHVGLFTTELAQLVGPNGHVFVFEPHPDNVRTISKRVARKGLSGRIDIIQAAVSDGAAPSVELYPGRNMSSGEWNIVGIDVDGHRHLPRLTVPAVSLDAFLPEQRINLVKMDIEGAEHLALRGMNRILVQQRPVLVIEFHSSTDYQECCDILLGAEYELLNVDESPAAIFPAAPTSHTLARPISQKGAING